MHSLYVFTKSKASLKLKELLSQSVYNLIMKERMNSEFKEVYDENEIHIEKIMRNSLTKWSGITNEQHVERTSEVHEPEVVSSWYNFA